MNAFAYDFVHLVLLAAGGSVQGRTKLQKLVYFAGALTGDLGRLGYRAHFYGPYSADVAGAVQDLRGLGFVDQSAASRGTMDPQGFEIARYDYQLTAEGRQVAEEKAGKRQDLWKKLTEALRRVGDAKTADYVRLAIAAKTHLLTQKAGNHLAPEALKEKTAEHGWNAFTPEQYDDAMQFLVKVGLSQATSRV